MRRRKQAIEKLQKKILCKDAIEKLQLLEKRMVYRMHLPAPLSFLEYIGDTYPQGVVLLLTQAAKYCSPHVYDNHSRTQMLPNVGATACLTSFFADKMLAPNHPDVTSALSLRVVNYLEDVARTVHGFHEARSVVRFFQDKNASPGAIMNYWPTMAALSDWEPLQNVTPSTSYRDIQGVAPYVPLFRRTSAVVASALLLEPLSPEESQPIKQSDGGVAVEFGFTDGDYSTQSFVLWRGDDARDQ